MTIEKDIYYQTVNKKVFLYFIAIFLFFGLMIAGSVGMLHTRESREYLERVAIAESVNITFQREMIASRLDAVVSDLMFLSRQNELRHLIDGNGFAETFKRWMSNEYLAFCLEKRVYDQIRYIDADGMEVVRVNFNAGRPYAVRDEELQRKADRYYFYDTLVLGPDEIFVSPFDLNVENGEIESPPKPMIRFGIPVFDSGGKKQGIVILNYLGETLIAAIRDMAGSARGRVMLVNGDGYWLSGPDPEDEWGFMIPAREDRKFSSRYPEAWREIAASDRCQVYTPAGLFTAATIYPLKKEAASALGPNRAYGDSILAVRDDEYYWKIVSHVPWETLDSGTRGIRTRHFVLALLLLPLAAISSWFIAQAVVRRKLDQVELYRSAHYDRLTGLPNRALFLDRLDQAIRDARRYGRRFGLMFIDLDGFKSVNDTLGHDAGDEVLVQVAGRLNHCLRDSDTVARMGGDEFTAILPAVDSPVSAHRVAKKIIEALNQPFHVSGHAPQVGASIGISLYPEDGTELDILLKKADKAMYQAKKDGKNDYRFFMPEF
ncbi:diguanylate cyclase domain-containing protein [Desulfococcus sp.]|uniref:diguanylate cyclase domain-containing protein n=1 Tax=Desulfococcus sp. TaxID=2025834 RepID=UPI0035940F66